MDLNDAVLMINNSDKIALIAHILPDGDTIGSCVALKRALNKMGKKVELYCQDSIPRTYNFLAGTEDFRTPDGPMGRYSLVISVDCSDKERLGPSCGDLFDKAEKTINIDHHISNTRFADINIVDSKASATGELIYQLITELGVELDKTIADGLYTAISTDTGSFGYSSTTSRTHSITAKLLQHGVEVDKLSTILFKQHSLAWTRLLGKALGTLKVYLDGKIAIICISKRMMDEAGAQEDETSGIINYAKDIEGVEVAALVKEGQNSIKVGLRSQSLIDVRQIAEQFGGGGHIRAAGCSIEASLEEAYDIILEAIKESFNNQ